MDLSVTRMLRKEHLSGHSIFNLREVKSKKELRLINSSGDSNELSIVWRSRCYCQGGWGISMPMHEGKSSLKAL